MERVSVIIPCYNSSRTIEDAINSVLLQTISNYEIIVVDDGSTDNSLEIVKKINGPICIVKQQNKGVSIARNTGIQHAKNSLIAFLDADDRWHPNKLELQYNKLLEGYDMVHCPAKNFGDLGKWTPSFTKYKKLSPNQYLEHLFVDNFIITSSVVTRKSCLEKAGFFDISLTHCEDWDLWIKISSFSKIISLENVLIEYRVNSNTLSAAIEEIISAGLLVINSNKALLPPYKRKSLVRKAIYEIYLNGYWRHLRAHNKLKSFMYSLSAITQKPYCKEGWKCALRVLIKTS